MVLWGGGLIVQMTDKNTLVLQSCTDVQSVECGLCSEGGVQSADDCSSVVSFKTEEEEIHIKEEEESIADDSSSVVSFKIEEEEINIKEEEEPIALLSTIKVEPEVSPQTFIKYIGLLSNFAFLSACLYT
jgi:hypothetical protein